MPRAGSPHPNARRGRQGSPHPIAISKARLESCSEPLENNVSGSDRPSAASIPQAVQPQQIPNFVSITPAIFVPAMFDYTKPQPDTPVDETETACVDRAMEELEDHMNSVKRNIATMILQEARRVNQDTAAAEQRYAGQGEQPRSKRLPPTKADEELLISKMEARCERGKEYGLPLEWGWREVPHVGPDPRDTPQEAAVTRIADLMRFGSMEMEGYEAHCVKVRTQRKAELAREGAKDQEKKLGRGTSGAGSAKTGTQEVDDFGIMINLDG